MPTAQLYLFDVLRYEQQLLLDVPSSAGWNTRCGARGDLDCVGRIVPSDMVGFTDIQKSPQYACGMALRFARIFRIRDDKRADEADTLATLRALAGRASG